MAKRCSTKTGCSYPRANWWKQTLGTDFYSQGGEALPDPSPLVGAALSTTEITNWWIGVGADSYTLQRSTSSDYSGATEVYSGADKTFADTGLSANTTYYYRVKAVFSDGDSAWVSFSVKTLSVVPLHAYDFRGIPYNSSNSYGKTGAPASVVQISEIYSYRGTPNTLIPSTATYASIQAIDTVMVENKNSAFTRISAWQYTPASNINLGTGDFTILFETSKNNASAVFKNIFTNSVDANTFIGTTTTFVRFRFVVGSTSNYQASWPSTLTANTKQRLILKRVGTSCYAGIMADDGTVSFGAPVTHADLGNIASFDRVFIIESFFYPSILNFYTSELTNAQIQEEFKRAEQPAYSFTALNKMLAPKGITTWSDLSSGYFIDPDTAASATAGASWIGLYTIGDYSCVRLLKKDPLIQDFLKMYRHSDSKISEDILMGIPSIIAESHNIGSIFPLDNTWYHFEISDHAQINSNLIVKRFGKDFDMTEYTQLPSGNGIPSLRAALVQYPQIIKTDNYVHVICHEYIGGSAKAVVDYRFSDNLNYCEKIRIALVGSNNWFYFSTVDSEDNKIRICLHYYQIDLTPDRYTFSAFVESTDDFDSVHNLMHGFDSGGVGAFTKSISNNQAALTISELQTNFLMTHDGTLDTKDCRVISPFFDPTDGKVYACGMNGADTLNFIHSVNGIFNEVPIDLLSHNIIGSYGPAGPVTHGANVPTMIRTGENSYRLFCQELVSGSIWKVVEFSTIDSWATSVYVGDITNDITTNHHRLMVTKNIHHTGGASAYSEKRLLTCSREQTVPDSHSDTFFADISG